MCSYIKSFVRLSRVGRFVALFCSTFDVIVVKDRRCVREGAFFMFLDSHMFQGRLMYIYFKYKSIHKIFKILISHIFVAKRVNFYRAEK